MAELSQNAADEVGAEASSHAAMHGGSFLNVPTRASRLILTERDLAVGAEVDEVEDVLANIDADRGEWRNGPIRGLLLRLKCSSLGRLPRGRSSRSIPLAGIGCQARDWPLKVVGRLTAGI